MSPVIYNCEACGAAFDSGDTTTHIEVCVPLSLMARVKICASCALPVVKMMPHFARKADMVRALEYGASKNVAKDIEHAFGAGEPDDGQRICRRCRHLIGGHGVNAMGQTVVGPERLFCSYDCREREARDLRGDPGLAPLTREINKTFGRKGEW